MCICQRRLFLIHASSSTSIKVTLQCVNLLANNVTECLKLHQLFTQTSTLLSKYNSNSWQKLHFADFNKISKWKPLLQITKYNREFFFSCQFQGSTFKSLLRQSDILIFLFYGYWLDSHYVIYFLVHEWHNFFWYCPGSRNFTAMCLKACM